MIYDLKQLFILFIIYSFIGWIIEMIFTFCLEKRVVDRGFMIGPYCPIYGLGCLLLICLLDFCKDNILLLFVFSILICSILEYLVSYIMEKIFKARWWDYSQFRFNLNGRICLETMLPFGILGSLIVSVVNPFLIKFIDLDSFIVSIILVLFLIDFIISISLVYSLKGTIKFISKDNTEEITKKVKEILRNKSFLHKRLVNAFPTFKSTIDKIREFVNK